MAITYPGSLDPAVGGGIATATLSVGGSGGQSHKAAHDNISAALVALETKVGATASTDTASHEYRLNNLAVLNRYYGVDTTNTNTYAITVASDFTLIPGTLVSFVVSNTATSASTLNVNGTGAFPIVNRAGITVGYGAGSGGYELFPNKTHLAVYTGGTTPTWRLLTPIGRYCSPSNPPASPQTYECAGADIVYFQVSFPNNINITLAHLAAGTVLILFLYISGTGPFTYQIGATNPAGGAMNMYVVPRGAGGGTPTNITSTAVSLSAGQYVWLVGQVQGPTAVYLI